MSIALIRLERNAKVRVLPREEAGIYLTLEGNPGGLYTIQNPRISPSTRHQA